MAAANIDEYIGGFDGVVKAKLQRMREIIHRSAPGAEEAMAYGIPTFRLNGNLVHFAGYKGHIGFYPTPSGIGAFREELSKYDFAKGSVKFPVDRPLPEKLIARIVAFRMAEQKESATAIRGRK